MIEDTVGQAPRHPWVEIGRQSVRFGIVGGPRGDWPALRDFVQMAEELGFDSYWRPDHPLLLPDCWTSLAALATSTRWLRLGSLVSCVFYRNPVTLARTVADVDRISQGRVVLGLGAGNIAAEFRAMGLAYPSIHERHAALAEALQVVPRLLRGETVEYQGDYCRVEGATLQPPPVQQPYVPLLVGGGGERTTLHLVISSRSTRTPPVLGRAPGVARRPRMRMCGASMRRCGSIAPQWGDLTTQCCARSTLSQRCWPTTRLRLPPSASARLRSCSRRATRRL